MSSDDNGTINEKSFRKFTGEIKIDPLLTEGMDGEIRRAGHYHKGTALGSSVSNRSTLDP